MRASRPAYSLARSLPVMTRQSEQRRLMYCQTCSVNSGCAWYSAMHAGVGRERGHDAVVGRLRDAAPDRAGAEAGDPTGEGGRLRGKRGAAEREARGRAERERKAGAPGYGHDRLAGSGWKRFAAWRQSIRRALRSIARLQNFAMEPRVSSRPRAAAGGGYDGRGGAGAAWRAPRRLPAPWPAVPALPRAAPRRLRLAASGARSPAA